MDILKLLNLDDWTNCGEHIEIAKGRYELKSTIKEMNKQYKREKQWLKVKK